MAKITQIDGVYFFVKDGNVFKRLRSGNPGPDASTTATVVIEAFARKAGFDDSPVTSETFIVINS